MEIQILVENVTEWEQKFAWFPKIISDVSKRTSANGKDVTYDVVTSIVWLQYYYRRVEVQTMTNTWYWKYSKTNNV